MGGWEIALIAVIVLLFFGPDKIPQIIKTVKKGIGFYTDARDQVQEVVSTQIISPEELDTLKDPLGLGEIGLGGGKTTPKSLLTPERKSLYSQAASTSASATPIQGGATAAAVIPAADAPPVSIPEPQSSAAQSAVKQAAAPAVAVPTVQEVSSVAKPASTAESIWASLEQVAVPSDEGKEG
ncbi:MAG: twin-arginine translocase TatA/TatE family subunit [Coriobacteriia bacterium]|nr:twin-arginine translocase TatA/TatE family subunit [Coriobacteriia bacterium]